MYARSPSIDTGLDEAPEWGSTIRGQLGAYLISRLLKHAVFEPAHGSLSTNGRIFEWNGMHTGMHHL